ncbi:ectonucleotide pyrophosphatase/phosphodiesterase [uncultured Mucilaginibacter sp.]|uniref:alkaline phosphatase family protein n=1 Tax=uncultured Mucilaginibacter sp. TaxID=797541 RepID=UPI0025FB13CD|nr:ectonucleotide pyrophosphatase/phosphodiesterase [uncultured Mucilaginibacter sp.]
MKSFLYGPLLSFLLSTFFCELASSQNIDTVQHAIVNRSNSSIEQQKPYVIMISVDGMRYDYATKYNAQHLTAAAKSGVIADGLIPSYPSITFPNHYTLVTGLYPSHSGLVGNKFYDSKLNKYYASKGAVAKEAHWYGGTPLWVLAEQQHMLSAGFYWVGSDVAIQNTYPSYYYAYNEQISLHSRINTVINWLSLPEDKRPHLINLYFPQVDFAGHHFGPESDETRKAVLLIDSAINALQLAVSKTGLPVNYIVLSDHGMTNINHAKPLQVPYDIIDTAKFRVTGEDVLVHIYAKDKSAIQATYSNLKQKADGKYDVYLKRSTPKRWHYDLRNDRYNRIGDILLVPRHPNVFVYTKNGKPNIGAHGYDPALVPDMKAFFYAWGPGIKPGLKVPAFYNVDVYAIVAKLLGLHIKEPIDSNYDTAKKILK